MHHLLFVCTANIYRSPLAAAFFSRKLQADGQLRTWVVRSAGTWTSRGLVLPSDLRSAARAAGLDLKEHLTRPLDRDLLARSDLIVVMERGHREALQVEFPFVREKVHLLSELADGLDYDIADPMNSGLKLGEIIRLMSGLVERAYPRICQLLGAERVSL